VLNCKEIAERASDYVDRDLSLWQRLKVRWHLRACAHCSRLIRHLRLTMSYLSRLNRPQASLDEAEAVVEKVLAAQSS
jgi:Putative zinc-finger